MYKKLVCISVQAEGSTMASLKRLSVDNDEECNQEVICDEYKPTPPLRHRSTATSARPRSHASPPKVESSSPTQRTQDGNWQAHCSTVKQRNSAMYKNDLMADVYFRVGPSNKQHRVPAHKYVLATASSVFYAMFYGGLADNQGDIDIPDVEIAAFNNLLKYMYTDEVNLTPETVLTTLYAAKKYMVPQLARECVRFMETSLSARNACVLLSQSRLFEEQDLTNRCWEVLDAQAEEALTSEAFTDMDHGTLEAVLQRESLNIRSELSLFRAACRWAEAECGRRDLEPSPDNKRHVLGSALYRVRIPCMDLQDYADTAAQSGILTPLESHNIFLHFTAQKKPRLPFETRIRRGLAPQRCLRFQSCAYRSNQWRYRGRCDSIQFCTDRRVFLAGFGLYGSSNGDTEYRAKIELKHNGTVLGQRSTSFKSDGSSNIFPVYFEYPIQIEAEAYYTASVILEGSELSYFGQEGLQEVHKGRVLFQFQCSSDSTNGTGVQGGQIPELIYYC